MKASYEVEIKVYVTGHRMAFFNGERVKGAIPPPDFKDGDKAILSCTWDGNNHPGPWQWKLLPAG
jgi:hypothetical protein